jgi:lysozyme
MNPSEQTLLEASLKEAEGYRSKAYKDSVGVWTIGYGTNLQELKIDQAQAMKWLRAEILRAEQECEKAFPWFSSLSPIRQRALIELVYNLGLSRFLLFKNTLKALEAGEFEEAANGLANSKWATQVGPKRSQRIIRMIAHESTT